MLKAYDYIKCYENTFWSWDSDDMYLHLIGGVTFAHWEEAKAYIVKLAPQGLPPFDVVAGIMAATMSDEFCDVGLCIQEYLVPSYPRDELNKRFKIFDTIHSMDEKFKRGDNRFILTAAVLNKVNVRFIESVSMNVAEELSNSEQQFFGAIGKNARHHLRKVANCFNFLSATFPTPQSIIDAMMGFDKENVNLEDIIPSSEEKKSELGETLLEQLQNELRTEKMSALIPYVMSGMNFPIHSSQSDNRPDGGVSDLSNKGHFDQLIVSEFAYDDDYFMNRIVNNEALFYQKEKAKNDNDDNLCVLIDSSLYMWGLPKLIATAVGCTIGMKEEKSEFDCFVVGSDLVPCDFTTLQGVLKGVRFTDASISPAEGIDLFVETEPNYSNTLLVTTEDSWKRPEMIRAREESAQLFDFVVFVNDKAEIKVLKSKGKQVVNFKLDLKTIWEVKKNDVSRKSVQPPSAYPLLFPINNDRIKYFFNYNEDVFFIDKSKGLFHIQKGTTEIGLRKGARLIMKIGHNLDVLGDIGLNKRGELELIMFSKSRKEIAIYNLALALEQIYPFPQWKSRMGQTFYHQNYTFYFTCSEGHWAIDEDFNSASEILQFNFGLNKAGAVRRASLKTKEFYTHTYFKRAKAVYITNQGEIVIRNRRLQAADESMQFFMPPNGSVSHRPTLSRLGERQTYTFASGDSIVMNPSGMVEFHFNEKNRPIGYELKLTKVGGHKLATVKALKINTGKGLKESKELIDGDAGGVLISHNFDKLNRIADEIRQLDNELVVKPVKLGMKFYLTSVGSLDVSLASGTFFTGNEMFKDDELRASQQVITAYEFYDLYIRSFIQNVTNGI